jgi:hypothetical protein
MEEKIFLLKTLTKFNSTTEDVYFKDTVIRLSNNFAFHENNLTCKFVNITKITELHLISFSIIHII